MKLAARPSIMDIQPYKGGEGRVDSVARLIRLASNENPLGCSSQARAAYMSAADDLHRYPDGAAADLRAAIGKKYTIDPDRIVCGAGSDELISLITRAYAGVGDEVLYSQYGFLMYPIAANTVGAVPVSAAEKNLRTDVDAVLGKVTDKTKIVFLANPNNPTGSWLTRTEMQKLARSLRSNILLVVDAAYAEFIDHPEYEDGRALVDAHENVVMLRTFSKIHGLAALRLGWGYFSPAVADVINRVRGPFNVSVPAQAAGIAALQDDDFIRRTIKMTNEGRTVLTDEISALDFQVYPSAGNFVLVKFGARAEEIRIALKEKGIFVRQMGAYGLPECLRITIGLPEDNKALVSALRGIV